MTEGKALVHPADRALAHFAAAATAEKYADLPGFDDGRKMWECFPQFLVREQYVRKRSEEIERDLLNALEIFATHGLRLSPSTDEARNAVVERDAIIEECAVAAGLAAWKHVGDDAYSQGMDRGAIHQAEKCVEAIRALKGSHQ